MQPNGHVNEGEIVQLSDHSGQESLACSNANWTLVTARDGG